MSIKCELYKSVESGSKDGEVSIKCELYNDVSGSNIGEMTLK